MDSSSPSLSTRQRPSSGKSGKRPGRQRAPSANVKNAWMRRIVTAAVVVVVFAAAFLLDTAAMLRLFWMSATGHHGPLARMIAFAIMMLISCAAVLAFLLPPRPPPPKKRRKKTVPVAVQNPRQGNVTANELPEIGDEEASRRRGRKIDSVTVQNPPPDNDGDCSAITGPNGKISAKKRNRKPSSATKPTSTGS